MFLNKQSKKLIIKNKNMDIKDMFMDLSLLNL